MRLISVILAVLLLLSFPAASYACSVYRKIETAEKKIALTFDDGPHPRYTEEILDILKEYGIHATFFVIGENAEMYPELIKRETDDGHEVENHTFRHIYLDGAGEDNIKEELSRANDAIKIISGADTRFIRPPGGRFSDGFFDIASGQSLGVVLWSIDTRDWSCPGVGEVVRSVLDNVSCGDIILMHDAVFGNSPTPEALRTIIPSLIERGYEFVTVSELILLSEKQSE